MYHAAPCIDSFFIVLFFLNLCTTVSAQAETAKMSETNKRLLLLGATGYIGGVLLSKWYANGFESLPFEVTAASRSTERLDMIAEVLGVSTVRLSLDDTAGLEEEVQKYDIVVQLADCDAFEATHAILRGMKARCELTSTLPLLYHASGAGKPNDLIELDQSN